MYMHYSCKKKSKFFKSVMISSDDFLKFLKLVSHPRISKFCFKRENQGYLE